MKINNLLAAHLGRQNEPKVQLMNRVKLLWICLLLFLAGCTGFYKTSNLSLFQDVHRAYRLALRDADFKAAMLVLDPAVSARAGMDAQPYEDVKVARYKVTNSSSNSNGSEVRQEVEIQYYRRNRPVVKYLLDHQIWRYQPDTKNWYLESGLPEFK